MGKNKLPNINGTEGNDSMLVGFTDVDLDQITTGSEKIYAYGGDDTVEAGGGNDWIYGGDGNDSLRGGQGNDKIWGNNGNDQLFGGEGNDQLLGGRGNDTLRGGLGDDRLFGNKGNNELYGGDGNDYISTGDQSSIAFGNTGNDTFEIRAKKGGDHEVTGGAGADEFNFVGMGTSAVSENIIHDFLIGTDSFSIDGMDAYTYFDTALYNLSGDTTETVLTTAGGDTITFEGVGVVDFFSEFVI